MSLIGNDGRAFKAYQLYVALRNHFTSKSYDFFKYNGKVKVSEEKFNTRRDRFIFEKLGRHPDARGLLIANLSEDSNRYITDIVSDRGQDIYARWMGRSSARSYNLRRYLQTKDCTLSALFKVEPNGYPPLITDMLSNKATLDDVVTLLKTFGEKRIIKYWDQNIDDPLLWPELKMRIQKYIPFVQVEKSLIKQTVVDCFSCK